MQHVTILPSSDLNIFRERAFLPALPAVLPRGAFKTIPAIRKWFHSDDPIQLNASYLSRFGSTIVPLEITHGSNFTRMQQSLGFFLECVAASSSTFVAQPNRYFTSYVPGARAVRRTKDSNSFFSAMAVTAPTARIYLAQAPLSELPQDLQNDVPTPELVRKAGKGDIYDSSIWIGQAPTYTPLHRDPNPNLFVQLAGSKVIRLFKPETGRAIFAAVQEKIGGDASENMRGEEMMQSAEKDALEEAVWGEYANHDGAAYQAELNGGDALFIPKGWWHSVKGVSQGINGSVSSL